MLPPNDTIVTEEQIQKDDTRFQELNKKPEIERTSDEIKELGELKDRYGKRMQSRIDKLSWEAKTAREEAAETRRLLEEERQKREDLESSRPPAKPVIEQEFVEIAGKKWYTDEALIAMTRSEELTEAEAIKYQQKRNKEEIKFDILQDIKKEDAVKSQNEARQRDARDILSRHPEWDKTHPSHNPNDPLFKLATELWNESYKYIPDGLTKAEKRAREILRIQDTTIDRSDDFSMDEGSRPGSTSRGRNEEETTLSEKEKEAAVRMYTLGGLLNPRTNKPYTESEAIAKALVAKKRRSA